MTEGQDLNKHINLFDVLLHDLESIDVVFEEEGRALLFLLLDSFDHFVTKLIISKTTLITISKNIQGKDGARKIISVSMYVS